MSLKKHLFYSLIYIFFYFIYLFIYFLNREIKKEYEIKTFFKKCLTIYYSYRRLKNKYKII